MNETEENDYVRRALRQAMPDDLPSAVAERMQNRIAVVHERLGARSTTLWAGIPHWIGELTMRQRIAAFGGVGIAAVLGLLLLWGGIAAKSVSAMEQMAEKVRQAKSYKCITKVTLETSEASGKPPKTMRVGVLYWLAPDLSREGFSDPSVWKGAGPERTTIKPGHDKQVFLIDNRARTVCSKQLGFLDDSAVGRLENLGRFSGEANRELGAKDINGRKARGFEIATEKIDPEFPPSLMEIWLDGETNLPVFVRFDAKTEHGVVTSQISDIQWNIDVDPGLFAPTPPEGYKDVTPRPLALEEQVRQITEALRIYAEIDGGHYPQSSHIGIGDLGRLLKTLRMITTKTENGVTTSRMELSGGKITAEQVHKIGEGFHQLQETHHVAYGKTVGPKDKEKVLLHWKLDDGRYEVIFGDLRAETVTAERLHALEGK